MVGRGPHHEILQPEAYDRAEYLLEGAVPKCVTVTLKKEIVRWIRQNEWGQPTSHEAT